MTRELDARRKQLLWRATHRGIKEMDMVVGGFAKSNLATMSEDELLEFATLLEFSDQDLLSWVTKQTEVPVVLNSRMLTAVLGFRPGGPT